MATKITTRAHYPDSLAERLNPVVASVRGRVQGAVGLHPYRVFILVRAWNGTEPGRGQFTETRTELRCGKDYNGDIAPPRVVLEGRYARAPQGMVEDGTAYVDELDPSYLEADLVDYGRLAKGDETYIEIVMDDRGGGGKDRPARRFTIEGTPEFDQPKFMWVLKLREVEPSSPFGNAQLSPSGDIV